MSQIFMMTGHNGAGKTTSALDLLPDILHCEEYINADSIAVGLSPFKSEKIAFAAGRLMLERIHQLTRQKSDFAFETTGASKSFAPFLLNCKQQGYVINLLYLWLESVELAIARVASRVENGGHDIPKDVIKRRYHKGLINFFNLYMPIADNWIIYDNSKSCQKIIAQKSTESDILISNHKIWHLLARDK